jgi:hypothetical protein
MPIRLSFRVYEIGSRPVRRKVAHAAREARRAETATLARGRHEHLAAAPAARELYETVLEDAGTSRSDPE